MTEHEKYVYLFEQLINKAYNSAINKQSFYQILNEDVQKLKQPDVIKSLPVHWCWWCELETGIKDDKCIYCSKPIGQ